MLKIFTLWLLSLTARVENGYIHCLCSSWFEASIPKPSANLESSIAFSSRVDSVISQVRIAIPILSRRSSLSSSLDRDCNRERASLKVLHSVAIVVSIAEVALYCTVCGHHREV